MQSKTKIGLWVLGIIVIGWIVVMASSSGKNPTVDTTVNTITVQPNEESMPAEVPATSETSVEKTYTIADVSTHNSASNCWTVVSGNVYDLTSWISRHPGGEKAILSICGKDGTVAFTGQHSGQEKPEKQLATFLLGPLTE